MSVDVYMILIVVDIWNIKVRIADCERSGGKCGQ